jgi:hypothetical protein
MAKPPYVFISRDELINHLRSEKTRKVAAAFFCNRLSNIESVVKEGVAGNTFRAFQKLPERPSVVFREWAIRRVTGAIERLKRIKTEDEYAVFVHESSVDLCSTWGTRMESEMGFGRGSKLFNLVLKKLSCLSNLDEGFRQRFIGLLHVPLDSYTIVGLRRLITSPMIPSNATMKFIETPNDYRLLQKYISDSAKEAGVPAIYYDIIAWDMAH